MGAWDTPGLSEDVAIGAYTPWYPLLPFEEAHVQWERTDGGSTDTIGIIVETSVDGGTTIDKHPVQEYWFDPSTPVAGTSFKVKGWAYFRVGVTRPIGSTDPITADIRVTRNGGLA
jgi:hypothetical protein